MLCICNAKGILGSRIHKTDKFVSSEISTSTIHFHFCVWRVCLAAQKNHTVDWEKKGTDFFSLHTKISVAKHTQHVTPVHLRAHLQFGTEGSRKKQMLLLLLVETGSVATSSLRSCVCVSRTAVYVLTQHFQNCCIFFSSYFIKAHVIIFFLLLLVAVPESCSNGQFHLRRVWCVYTRGTTVRMYVHANGTTPMIIIWWLRRYSFQKTHFHIKFSVFVCKNAEKPSLCHISFLFSKLSADWMWKRERERREVESQTYTNMYILQNAYNPSLEVIFFCFFFAILFAYNFVLMCFVVFMYSNYVECVCFILLCVGIGTTREWEK